MTCPSDTIARTEEPIAYLGFPENEPTPKYDLVYAGTTRIPGYKYRPIYAPQDHPQAVKDRRGESVQ